MRRTRGLVAVLTLGVLFGIRVHAEPITLRNVGGLTEAARVDVGFFAETIHFLDDARIAINDHRDGTTLIWDSSVGGEAGLEDPRWDGEVLAVSEDRETVAVVSRSGVVTIADASDPQVRTELCTVENMPHAEAAFSPDGRVLALFNRRTEIELWDTATGTLLAVLVGHNSNLFDLEFAPDGTMLATAGGGSGALSEEDSCVKVWGVASGELVISLPTADIGDNHAVVFADDGARLISGGTGKLVAWDTATWERVFESGPSYVGNYGLDVSPNQEILACAYHGWTVQLINLSTMRTTMSLRAEREPLAVAFSPDGSKLAAGYPDGAVIVWTARR